MDDVDAVQAKASLMDGAMSRAAYGLAETADRYLFQTMAGAAPAGQYPGHWGGSGCADGGQRI